MNWIIENTDKFEYHTNLNILLEPIKDAIQEFKWLITDLEINTKELERLPINQEKDWFLISAEEMEMIRNSDIQIIWGVFSAINKNEKIEITNTELPFADGNEQVWENGNIQFNRSRMEIISWDSSFTIVKFIDEDLSREFKSYFTEAIELEKF